MEVNTSQVGQGFAQVGQDIAESRANVTEQRSNVAERAQDLSVSAEIEDRARQEIEPEAITSAVSELNQFVQANNRQLDFSVDEGSNRQVVRVTDSESGEVIRQIPSEEILSLSERLRDLQTDVGAAVGLLFNRQV